MLRAGLLLFLVAGTIVAQESNRVALVVSLGNGEVLTKCVQFVEDEITGYEALSRSGLPFDSTIVGLGASVCRIEEVGCPATNCFCECKGGGPCLYWSYWQVQGGEWKYSQIGATIRTVVDGDIEGWVWDVGTPSEAPPPPPITFDEVCSDEEILEAPTAQTELPMLATSAPDLAAESDSAAAGIAAAELAAEQVSLDEGTGDQAPSWPPLVVGGSVVAVIAALIIVARRGWTSK